MSPFTPMFRSTWRIPRPRGSVEHLGRSVKAGQVLGRIYDMQTFALLEDLLSPCSGILYVVRAYGPTRPGDSAYVVGEERGAWRYSPSRQG